MAGVSGGDAHGDKMKPEKEEGDEPEWKKKQSELGEEWEIRWLKGYETEHKRRQIRRDATVAAGKPLTLGYVCKVGEELCTYTGHKIGSIYGPLHGITTTGIATGPGKNSPMYFDPVSGRIGTLGEKVIQRIWVMNKMRGMTVPALGRSAHPVPSTANFITQALYLDKYYVMTKTVPRVPMIEFKGIGDVLEGSGIEKIRLWIRNGPTVFEGLL